jgi:ribosomal protein L32
MSMDVRVGNADDLKVIEILLWCPECGERHVDKNEFASKPHHTHACQHCGHVWRPAIVCTVGVQFLPGFKDEKQRREPRVQVNDNSSAYFSQMSNVNTDILERFKASVRSDLHSLTLRDLSTLMDMVRADTTSKVEHGLRLNMDAPPGQVS